MSLRFKCPYSGNVVEVNHESELPEGQIFERVADKPQPAPAEARPIYAPMTWAQVVAAAHGAA